MKSPRLSHVSEVLWTVPARIRQVLRIDDVDFVHFHSLSSHNAGPQQTRISCLSSARTWFETNA